MASRFIPLRALLVRLLPLLPLGLVICGTPLRAQQAAIQNPLIEVGMGMSTSEIVPLKQTGTGAPPPPPRTDLVLKFVGGASPTEGNVELKATAGGAKITVFDQNNSSVTLPKTWDMTNTTDSFPLNYKIEGIVVSGSKDDVALEFSHTVNSKTKNKTVKVTVVKAEFKENAPNEGFDPTITPRALMVPKPGTNKAKLEITPSDAAADAAVTSVAAATATVSPAAPTASPQDITATGVAKGSTELEVKMDSVLLVKLTLDVKEKLTKTVAIHAITEDNDDVQTFPVGNGQAGQTAITAGPDGILNTTPSGDDVISGISITTGPNGVCNSAKSGDDVQVIALNSGKPNAICVTKGSNNFRDTVPAGDDIINGDSIDTGPNGICNTTANAVDLVPTNVPSAAALETYLNDVWGKQANVYFTVTRSDHAVNYDLDRNAKLADPELVSATDIEINAISTSIRDGSVDYNMYFVNTVEYPVAFTLRARAEGWIQDAHAGSVLYIAAHELGHAIGRSGHSGNNLDLMFASDRSSSPTRVIKQDWDLANP